MKTLTTETTVEIKKRIWKKAKVKFLKNVPKEYKVSVEGLEDDTKYCHPIIHLDENIIIRGQIDIGNEDVYALHLVLKEKLQLSPYLYTMSLDIENDEHFEYLVKNYQKLKPILIDSLSEIEKLHILKHDLEVVQNNIMYNTIAIEVDKTKLEESISKLYEVSEYLENNRLNK